MGWNMIDVKVLGSNIRNLRRIAGLQLNEFSLLMGVSENYFGTIERGQQIPSVALFIKIMNYFGVSANDLLNENLISKNLNTEYKRKIYTLLNDFDDNDFDYLANMAKRISAIAGI